MGNEPSLNSSYLDDNSNNFKYLPNTTFAADLETYKLHNSYVDKTNSNFCLPFIKAALFRPFIKVNFLTREEKTEDIGIMWMGVNEVNAPLPYIESYLDENNEMIFSQFYFVYGQN